MSDSTTKPMVPELCLQKIREIKPLKGSSGSDRIFDVEQLKTTAMSEFVDKKTNEFDYHKLIPFLVGAIQNLADRVEVLESSIASL